MKVPEKIIALATTPRTVIVLTNQGSVYNLRAKHTRKDMKDSVEYSWEKLPELP